VRRRPLASGGAPGGGPDAGKPGDPCKCFHNGDLGADEPERNDVLTEHSYPKHTLKYFFVPVKKRLVRGEEHPQNIRECAIRGGKETQLSSCLDSASGGTETGCGRTTTAWTANRGSLQRSLSTRAGATSVASGAQLNGYYPSTEAGEGAPSPAPIPKTKPKIPKRKFLLG
jgi:hypothetical protein